MAGRNSTSPSSSSAPTDIGDDVGRSRDVVGRQDDLAVAVGVALHRDGVTHAASQTDVEADGGSLDSLFGALSDPTRRMLVERLLTKGPTTATVLAETTPLTRQAVLKHLQVLESAGLLDHERVGREVRYRVTPQPLASAVGWILDTAGLWDKRIDRLRRLVDLDVTVLRPGTSCADCQGSGPSPERTDPIWPAVGSGELVRRAREHRPIADPRSDTDYECPTASARWPNHRARQRNHSNCPNLPKPSRQRRFPPAKGEG